MIDPVNLKNDYMGGGICHNGSHFDRMYSVRLTVRSDVFSSFS